MVSDVAMMRATLSDSAGYNSRNVTHAERTHEMETDAEPRDSALPEDGG